jgi:hypothetical protein
MYKCVKYQVDSSLTDLFTSAWSPSLIDLCHFKVSVLVPLEWGHQTLSYFGFLTYPHTSCMYSLLIMRPKSNHITAFSLDLKSAYEGEHMIFGLLRLANHAQNEKDCNHYLKKKKSFVSFSLFTINNLVFLLGFCQGTFKSLEFPKCRSVCVTDGGPWDLTWVYINEMTHWWAPCLSRKANMWSKDWGFGLCGISLITWTRRCGETGSSVQSWGQWFPDR